MAGQINRWTDSRNGQVERESEIYIHIQTARLYGIALHLEHGA